MNRLRTSSGRAPLAIQRRAVARRTATKQFMAYMLDHIEERMDALAQYYAPLIAEHTKDVALCSPKKR